MRNGNLLKSRVSENCIKQIRVNQGVGVLELKIYIKIEKYRLSLQETTNSQALCTSMA